MTNSRFPGLLRIGKSGISGCGLCQTTTGRGSVGICSGPGLRGTLGIQSQGCPPGMGGRDAPCCHLTTNRQGWRCTQACSRGAEVSGMHGLLPVRPQGQVFQQLSGIHRGSNYILYMLYFCYRTLLPPGLHHSRTGRPTACWLIQPVLPPGHQHTRIAPTLVQAHRPSGSSWEHGTAGGHVLTLEQGSPPPPRSRWIRRACPHTGQELAGPQRPGETGSLVSPSRHAL